jgi:hypothetical protein
MFWEAEERYGARFIHNNTVEGKGKVVPLQA